MAYTGSDRFSLVRKVGDAGQSRGPLVGSPFQLNFDCQYNMLTPVEAGSMLYFHMKVDGTGSRDIHDANGSVTPVEFQYIVPAGKIAFVDRVIFNTAGRAIEPDLFIQIVALTTGCKVEVLDTDDTVLFDFLDGLTIKDNIGFSCLTAVDALVNDSMGVNRDHLSISWQISNSGGSLYLTAGQKLTFTVQDDISGIGSATPAGFFVAIVQGLEFTV